MNIVIIEDDLVTLESLRLDLLELDSNNTILGTASSVKNGIDLLKKHSPDVILLDVELEDGESFEILKNISTLKCPIIFISAHDHYAVKAIKFFALDFLVKPYPKEELKEAMEKAKNQLKKEHNAQERLNQFVETFRRKKIENIALSNSDGIHFIKIDTIIRAEAFKNYTTFYLMEDNKIVVSKNIGEYEVLLKEHSFFRVHQSHLVNLNFVKRIEGNINAGGSLYLKDGSAIPISRNKKQALLQQIKSM